MRVGGREEGNEDCSVVTLSLVMGSTICSI